MSEYRDGYSEAAEVSTSAYYDWLERSQAPTAAEWDEALVVNEMWDIHHRQDDTYGSPRLTGELRRRGYDVNHKKVERLQVENGIYARDGRRRKVRTTVPDVAAPPPPDLVQRDFGPGEPGTRTCGDITYIGTGEGWLCMADVLDLGSRRIIGYALADHMRSELVEQAPAMAVATRGGDVAGTVFHHDRGAQYLGRDFRALCLTHEVSQSVGRIGSSPLTRLFR
ncbi:MAG: IS3 family transposase [Acidimicrobiales bacterium]